MTLEYDNNCLPSGGDNTLDSDKHVTKGNIVRLLSVYEISTIALKLMTNDWWVRPIRYLHGYMITEEYSRDGSERNELFKN